MARAAVRAFIPCRRVAAPGVVRSSEIAFALDVLCRVGSDLALERGLGTDPNGAPNQYVLASLIFV